MNAATPYRQVLLATDYSELCEKALIEAVRFASQHEARLHILHVVEGTGPAKGAYNHPHWSHAPGKDQARLDAIAEDVRRHYADVVASLVTAKSPAAGILAFAAEQAVDLIVVGTHGRSKVAEMFLGSVAQKVVLDAPLPVLVVGYGDDRPKPAVLAAVKLTPASEGLIRRAVDLAALRSGPLTIVHAVPTSSDRPVAETALRAAVGKAAVPDSVKRAVRVGSPAAAILEQAARCDAGLIVIAPSRRRSGRGMAANGVAARLLRGAQCPVLVHRN